MKHWTVCHADYRNVRKDAKQHENYVEPNETLDGVMQITVMFVRAPSNKKIMSNPMKHWTVCHTDYCNVREGAKQHENLRWLQAFAYLFVRLVNIQIAFPG